MSQAFETAVAAGRDLAYGTANSDVSREFADVPGDRAASDSIPGQTMQGDLPLYLVDGNPVVPTETTARGFQLAVKRWLLDVPFALVGMIVLLPVLVATALAIKLTSPGPALFTQTRVGLGGRHFRILKFRTLRAERCDDSGTAQVVDGDERLTPIGQFLRRSSIDELPQLWNIIVGDMALIGPRPMVPGMQVAGADYRDVVPYYDFRHRMRPGLSGWAQANGLRGSVGTATAARQRIDFDCAYVQNFSVWLDIRIAILTFQREFWSGTGL